MSQTIEEMIRAKAQSAGTAMRKLAKTPSEVRDNALLAMADSINTFKAKIVEANQVDLAEGRKTGVPGPLMERLALGEEKLDRMVNNLRAVAELPDPIGKTTHLDVRPQRTNNRHRPRPNWCGWGHLRVAS